jgi:hypothetical protein
VVQIWPSSQLLPVSGSAVQPPADSLQMPSLHWSANEEQSGGGPPVQVPVWHVSLVVHASPSSQLLPVSGSAVQPPADSLQMPSLHWSANEEQSGGGPPTQVPVWQASAVVQTRPSLQGVSFMTGSAVHPPAVSRQTPSLHWSANEEQSGGGPPTQVPDWHISAVVQACPSSQPVPGGSGSGTQRLRLSSQTPALHWLPAEEQSRAGPPVQVPP